MKKRYRVNLDCGCHKFLPIGQECVAGATWLWCNNHDQGALVINAPEEIPVFPGAKNDTLSNVCFIPRRGDFEAYVDGRFGYGPSPLLAIEEAMGK